MSNTKLLATTLLIPIFLSTNLSTVSADSFTDVREGNAYFVAISHLKEKNIIEGYEDGSFKPNKEINRAEALKMLTLASGVFKDPPVKPSTADAKAPCRAGCAADAKAPCRAGCAADAKAPFTDTPLKAWYTPYLVAAKDQKIIDGYKDGSFKPDVTINLAEALKMYFESVNTINKDQINFANGLDVNFKDTAPDAWYSKYTSYAGVHEIIDISDENTINPTQKMTRGYLAEIIYRTMQNKEGFEFGNATYYQGLPTKDHDSYDKSLMLTAHKTLPFGTIVEVINLSNGKSVKVKVSDRGPFGPGRVLDLSKTAFAKLAPPSEGVIPIQFHQVAPDL
ncbi:S-layer homology domain-containing protein [Candidatus Peregrinibacteria bacterium]|nr:S-layer homology domain-containing protein [Candidatus Peregrinibacteria bacterium]